MAYPIGSKVTPSLRNPENGERIPFPAIIIGAVEERDVQLAALPATDRYPARPARTIKGQFQMAVSLRTTRPDEKGKTTSYRRLSVERTDDPRLTPPRFSMVEGLDVDGTTGEIFDLQTLVEAAVAEGQAFSEANAAARAKDLADAGVTL